YSVEYIHCSSDNVSLDGILIPELKILFVDGTAPHTIDPVIPGAVDEIINLGSFLNVRKLDKHKAAIIQTNKAKSNKYLSAYRYLKAAGIIHDEISSIYDLYVDVDKFNEMCEKAVTKLFAHSYGKRNGNARKLFTESFTANGYISHTERFFEDNEVWAVAGNDTNFSSIFLDRILNEAVKNGYT
ncbi:MAG TPA: ATPase, partial [Clostridiales bacterium]|nr:ATPase [Clostridiales bacterium]